MPPQPIGNGRKHFWNRLGRISETVSLTIALRRKTRATGRSNLLADFMIAFDHFG
jgi:hypothetical protein